VRCQAINNRGHGIGVPDVPNAPAHRVEWTAADRVNAEQVQWLGSLGSPAPIVPQSHCRNEQPRCNSEAQRANCGTQMRGAICSLFNAGVLLRPDIDGATKHRHHESRTSKLPVEHGETNGPLRRTRPHRFALTHQADRTPRDWERLKNDAFQSELASPLGELE